MINLGHLCRFPAAKALLTLISCLLELYVAHDATAQQVAFRPYNEHEGLSNGVVSCLKQDDTGYIISCGEHGLYIYDGRRFFNLGPTQGLPEGGVVYDVAFSQDRRIVVRYLHRVFVSDRPLSSSTPPQALMFEAVTLTHGDLDNEQTGQLLTWDGGVVFVGGGKLWYLEFPPQPLRPQLRTLATVLGQPEFAVPNSSALASDKRVLWFTNNNNQICGLSQGPTRCFGTKDGLPPVKWLSLKMGSDGHLLGRSDLLLVDIDLDTARIQTSSLPNQVGMSPISTRHMVLEINPSGQLVTLSADGLMIREDRGWKNLTTANGLPETPVGAILFDHQKALWLGTAGSGIYKANGYGVWQNWDQTDGPMKGLVWQIARQKGGPLWVASDGGVTALATSQELLPPQSHFADPSFALVVDRFGRLWRSVGAAGVTVTDPATGVSRHFALPPVNQILQGKDDRLWFLTEAGVFFFDNAQVIRGEPSPAAGFHNRAIAAAMATDGSLWIMDSKHLTHRHNDGTSSVLAFNWPQTDFDPLVIAEQAPDTLWIGGAGGGLYELVLSDDRLVKVTQYGSSDLRSNSVLSLLVDRRGWIWVGTDSGISAFDGSRWVSATMDDGLIWNDMDQSSVLDDPDGSIWFGTSRGLSHLLEPKKIFERQTYSPVITSVEIGEVAYPGRAVKYTRQPLTLSFGVLNSQSDAVIRFRYRLDGVDQAWADTSSGYARYPFLPPGHHRFTVVAYDPLKHQVSPPSSIILRMQVPIWARWPFIAAYVALLIGTFYAMLRLRIRFLLKQRKALLREVERQTQRIRDAQAALFLQATQDGLTKLLTRSEIQRRLDDVLQAVDTANDLTIGLLDIDHFKRINDAHGHLAGDEVLRELGRRLKEEMMPGEYAGRYGGEEILLVLSTKSMPGAERVRDLKSAVFDPVYTVGTHMINVTCSIGVTSARAHDDWTSLIGRADRALYHAKHTGRDRIIESVGDSRSSTPQ